MRAVTHNIVHTLNLGDTSRAVKRALLSSPQIVSFQEFDQNDDLALKLIGDFADEKGLFPRHNKKNYVVCRGKVTGLPVLLRKAYVDKILSIRSIQVTKKHGAARASFATEVIFMNRWGHEVAVLNSHPVAHHERPDFRASFEEAKKYYPRWAQEQKKSGFIPMVMMDGNGIKDIAGLISCWDGHQEMPTGPGGLTIDAVWTLGRSDAVDTFGTPSDHNGVVATYKHLSF
jgi:hypothetical protein